MSNVVWKDWFGNRLNYIYITVFLKGETHRFTSPVDAITFLENYDEGSINNEHFTFGSYDVLTDFIEGTEHSTKGKTKQMTIDIIRWMFEFYRDEDGEIKRRGLL
ncbi:MAG: hypothetical protein FWE06_07690 [Oscillospiraceae bacterium]|nr:hypothetical protein [Oscillospiraceae bacterium]